MQFIWAGGDIAVGLNIVQPKKGVTATVIWLGNGNSRYSIAETNTDGMVHYRHKKDADGKIITDSEGKLIPNLFTRAELAEYLNNCSNSWIPASIFSGNGRRLLTTSEGRIREETIGMKK